ncbi:hypothetical protein HYU10_01470 [Candidatus Woesearchaeota archaeon]|nr:hypothetical protein [Candidatus Woesearchaeota archaeon]MBI2130416.1 hypothetical protein [Candidatus Woesearchaeota archaeon]MBI2661461.1 hypothetical protein [Candidatus Woesearchaeota archaeon]
MVFNFSEILDLVMMSAYLGYLFSDIFPRPKENYDPLKHYSSRYDWSGFKMAILATAPAVLAHELAHKFVAMGFGLDAIFYAFYRDSLTLTLAAFSIIAKLTGFGFFLIVPGFVSISGSGTPLQFAMSAIAGPLLNLGFWLAAFYVIRAKKYRKKHLIFWTLTKRINMFLFIFNMLPIPGFDGYKFFMWVIRAFV